MGTQKDSQGSPSAFERLLEALLRVPKAEIDNLEAERPKRPKRKAKKPAA